LASTVRPSFIKSKAVAKAIYEYISGDSLPTNYCKGHQDVDEMAAFALAGQDLDSITDLRELNGHPESDTFERFCEEAAVYVESLARMDNRRHGTLALGAATLMLCCHCCHHSVSYWMSHECVDSQLLCASLPYL